MINNRIHLLIFFSLLIAVNVCGQVPVSRQPLVDVLEDLQDYYGYQFNYASETVEGFSVVPPKKKFSITKTIQFLQEQTGLNFIILNNNFISIKRPNLELCGYLKDKDTQEPIKNATVQARKSATLTDENGYFMLNLSSNDEEIIIRHIGYKTLNRGYLFFKKDACGDIYLLPQQQQLAEIILSDFLVQGIDKLNDGSFKINFDRFGILPGLTEADVLQSVQAFPGIQSINETVSNINIRGGTHDQNLILWDDIKMYQSGHFFGLISMYNPQITQKVILRKNGTHVSHTDGVSGTIAMETDKNINTDFQGNIGINFIDANGFADIPLGKNSSVQVAARKAINDFIETPTYTQYFDRIFQDTEVQSNADNVLNSDQQFDFHDQSLRWLFKPSEKDELQLNFINAHNELVFNENAVLDNEESTRESSLTQNSIAGGLQYRRFWTKRFKTSLNVYETDYMLRAINANILDDQRFIQENKVSETGAILEAFHSFKERWQLLSGYQFVETKITNLDDVDNPIFFRLEGEVVRTHGVFSQLDFVSEDRRTHLNAGLRYNIIGKFNKHIWEPRLSLNQRFLENFNLEILGEFKHQNTSQVINFQNDFLGIEKRRWQLSDNNEIPVVLSKQVSAGLSYGANGWLINAVGYFKNVDGITAQSQGFQNQYEFVKSKGSYDAIGMDILIRKQFNNANAWFSYSSLNSDYTFDVPIEKTFTSNLEIMHALTFGTSYTTEHFRFSAGLNWRSGKPTTGPMSDNEVQDDVINYDLANSSSLNDYMRVDFSAIYQFNIGINTSANIGLSVWNLLDRENTINSFYRVNSLGFAEEVKQNSLGITPNAVFRIYF